MRTRALFVAVLAALLVTGALSSIARADGDPGSDVLVFQDLFVGSDAGVSVAQQVQLGGLLQAASRDGFPIRVAIIAQRDDLGAVTALWQRPRAYARFLGIELSLAYSERLLVVMPNGFGFNWPGHSTTSAYRSLARVSIGPGGTGLFSATQAAVRQLAAAAGLTVTAAGQPGRVAAAPAPGIEHAGSAAGRRAASDDRALIGAAAGAALLAATLAVIVVRRRRARSRPRPGIGSALVHMRVSLGRLGRSVPRSALVWGCAVLAVLAIADMVLVIVAPSSSSSSASASALVGNAYLDPGTSLFRPAPDFTLSDQFGQRRSLDSLRGKVVFLAFTDSECTTICPLTTAAIVDAKAMLGAAGSRVALLGVDANPADTSIEDVWSYSELHGMLGKWDFLTGSRSQLQRVWNAYGIEAEIERGEIAHTPALFVIDPEGRLRKLYITQQSYAAVGQLGQLLAQEASSLLPGRPPVHSSISYAQIPGISPATSISLPRAGGGAVRLGSVGSARLLVFFATWDQEVTSIGGHLDELDRYASSAPAAGLPALTAVDEGRIEPSAAALPQFLRALPRPLSYPVAIDDSGRVADGYEVQGVPWFVLVSPAGQILWYREVSTDGWPSGAALARQVRAALARAPKAPAGAAAAEQELAGSPPALAGLHSQADQLLGSEPALAARVRALRGYPIVINAWASWCGPCRSEFGLFANASVLDGRRVAFLGADTEDSAGDARSFLAQHPVSYPSYRSGTTDLGSLAVIEGLPTTIFIDRAGKVVYVHTGQYDSQGTLDQDIGSYALGG